MAPPALPTAAALVLVAAAIITFVTGIPLSETPLSESVQCHVCGPTSNLLTGQPPPPCPSEILDSPIKTCPGNHRGCLTIYDGEAVTRTCGERAFQECTVANGVVYCYCAGRLCNTLSEPSMQQTRLEWLQDRCRDGEPACELGSGFGPDTSDDNDDDDLITERWRGQGRGREDDPSTSSAAPSSSTTTTTTTTAASSSTSTWNDLYISSSREEATSGASVTTEFTESTDGSSGKGGAEGIREHGAAAVIALTVGAVLVWNRI